MVVVRSCAGVTNLNRAVTHPPRGAMCTHVGERHAFTPVGSQLFWGAPAKRGGCYGTALGKHASPRRAPPLAPHSRDLLLGVLLTPVHASFYTSFQGLAEINW